MRLKIPQSLVSPGIHAYAGGIALGGSGKVVEVRLLGEVAVLVDGRGIDLGPARQRCVLAALAVDVGRVVSVDVLAERVWGDHSPLRARATLVNYLSRLRQALAVMDAAHLVRKAGGYALEVGQSAVDLHLFHDLCARARARDDRQIVTLLEEALGLWRGEALTGLDGDWSAAERDRLHQQRLNAEHDLVDALLRLGHGEDLVAGLSARVADNPLDERVAGQYMLALYRAGRATDALEHHRRLRERLVGDLGIDPGTVLQDLHRRILAADPALSTTTAEVNKPSVVPLQLPAVPGLFTGRVTALTQLDRALTTSAGGSSAQGGRGATAVISAIGGIGKTWLALAWAHRNLHRFPDGQLWVDLRGFSPGEPKQAADVLADFLAALGVDRDHQPQDPDARAALYRTHTAGKRMLLLLDNAATPDQVVPLLPGGDSCTVLITSRHRLPALLTRHGAHPVHLDVLTHAEARTLLDDSLGGTRAAVAKQAVTELSGLCGGFPLALGLVAARIRSSPDLVHEIVEDLRELGLDALDSDSPDASLPTILSYSLRQLTDENRTVFGLLGIAPGPDTTLHAVAALAGLPEVRARKALSALEEASLLERRLHGRYAMHDLVRAYAADTACQLPDEVREVPLRRVVDFYLHTSYTGERVLDPHRPAVHLGTPAPGTRPQVLPDTRAAFDWFDAEYPNLLAAQHVATTRRWYAAVWQMAWTLTTFQNRRGHSHDQLAVMRAALAAGSHLDTPAVHMLLHRLMGMAYADVGRYDEAVEHLNQALVLAEHHDDLLNQGRNHRGLAWTWSHAGDTSKALHHATLALDVHRLLDNPVEEALSRCLAASYAAFAGDYDRASEDCEIALRQCREHGIRDGEASTLTAMGYIGHHTGHHHRAVRDYYAAITLHRDTGNVYLMADVLAQVGRPLAVLGHHRRARAAWQEALQMYQEQGRRDYATRVRRQLDELSSQGDSCD
ncbi:BTAD domain-containing putative transcriptional regulator [Lentzea sp. BCCO 10_0061]|uniref:BTAD domain-containing putative transcriptional regulator n=1 Tax=Lentzea sokolovensis TaxID=3095429 RepID=A0ABU4VAA9_9PSEU|nr:BTAD domain-containing putative transcriptional regulator [Lentzea sp. BCCO 10_0061]MDX8148704.1 BTAD domain-containing putative transcriptional regulator [Lentzea sp. BCCO 10_0061]